MPTSLAELLQQSGLLARFYDCGRHITPISGRDMLLLETGQLAYPYPYQQQAWLGLLFWSAENPHLPFLWFLRFPLDELGGLDLSARDVFLNQLLLSLGADQKHWLNGNRLRGVLENNPYGFTPAPERQACMHSLAKIALQSPPSQYYDDAVNLLNTPTPDWQQLPLQGLADIVMRGEHDETLAQLLLHIPEEGLHSLCLCLENTTPSAIIENSLYQRLNRERESTRQNKDLFSSLIRALSQSPHADQRQALCLSLLDSLPTNLNLLTALAARCTEDLTRPELFDTFMNGLVKYCQKHDHYMPFTQLVGDLIFLPHLRQSLRHWLTQASQEPSLQEAVASLGIRK